MSVFNFKSMLLLIAVTALVGCRNPAVGMQGYYAGELMKGNERVKVTAEVPAIGNRDGSIAFTVRPTGGNGQAVNYQVAFINKKQVELTVSGMVRDLPLRWKKSCGFGHTSGESWRLCVGNGQIQLDVGTSYSLQLSRASASQPPQRPQQPGQQPQTPAQSRIYSLDELVGKVKVSNYTVAQEAERLFRARKEIKVAAARLLPHLSIANLIGLATGTSLSVYDTLGNIVPFIFPSNWYNKKATKDLYYAEKYSFAALRANQVNVLEGLYYAVLRDKSVLALVNEQLTWMKKVQRTIEIKEQAGREVPGTAAYFGTKIAKLDMDRIKLEDHVRNSYSLLAQSVGLPPRGSISGIAPVPAIDLTSLEPIDAGDFARKAGECSYELKTMRALLNASYNQRRATHWSWLAPGGGLDIGFGMAPTFQIASSNVREMRSKLEEAESQIELQSEIVASSYNRALSTFDIVNRAYAESERYLARMVAQYSDNTGAADPTFMVEFMAAHAELLEFLGERYSAISDLMTARAQYNRLLLNGHYSESSVTEGFAAQPAELR